MISIYDNGLPSGWEEDSLRNVSLRKRGCSWTKDDETDQRDPTGIPVLRIPNIQQGLDLTGLLHIRNVSADALRQSAVTKGWILFVGSNGNPNRIGDSALMTVDRAMVFGSFLMGLTPKEPDRITPKFLASWLELHRVHEAFSKTSQRTTGLANFSWDAVRRLTVRFPKDRVEQERITRLLDVVDDVFAAAKVKLAAARRLKTALMQQLFTRGVPGRHTNLAKTKIGHIPQSWEVLPLSKLATVESGIALNRERKPRFHPHPYLTVINVHREKLDLTDVRSMEVFPHEIPNALLEEGDIVAVEGHANAYEIGRAALIDHEAAGFAYQNHLFRIRLLPDAKLNQLFLLGVLNSERVRRHWVATCNTSSGLNTINHRGLRRLLIQRPGSDEQEEIAGLVASANENIFSCELEIIAIERLKRSLLQNLLTGRVRVRI